MRHGDPELDREVRAENKKRPLRRRDGLLVLAAIVALVVTVVLYNA
jgi:hypothetical protein